MQKTATKSSPRPELRHSESPMNQGRNDSVVEYDDLPRVVDVGDSGLSLPDLGDSDRDEEPYEKFMAEESGRSASGAVNDEYVDDAKDDDLTPTYDERNYTDDVDTSPIEPRYGGVVGHQVLTRKVVTRKVLKVLSFKKISPDSPPQAKGILCCQPSS